MKTTTGSPVFESSLRIVKNELVGFTEQCATSTDFASVYKKAFDIVSRELNMPCSICTDEDGHGPLYCERNGEIISITCLSCVRHSNWCKTHVDQRK